MLEDSQPDQAAKRKVVCEQIDETLLQLLRNAQRLQELRNAAAGYMREGFFNFANARFDSEQLDLSSTAYAGRDMVAHTTVDVSREFKSNSSSFSSSSSHRGNDGGEGVVVFHLQQRKSVTGPKKKPLQSCSGSQEMERQGSSTLRRRPGMPKSRKEEEKDTILGSTLPMVTPGCDPVKWFGLLCPHDLTHKAPANFQAALRLWVDVCNLQNYIMKQEKDLMKLVQQRKEFE